LNVTRACCWPCGHQFNRLTSITSPNFPGNNVTYNLRRAQSLCIGNVVQSAGLPAQQDTGAAIATAAKQLPLSTRVARNEPHVGHPNRKRSRTGFEKAE